MHTSGLCTHITTQYLQHTFSTCQGTLGACDSPQLMEDLHWRRDPKQAPAVMGNERRREAAGRTED